MMAEWRLFSSWPAAGLKARLDALAAGESAPAVNTATGEIMEDR